MIAIDRPMPCECRDCPLMQYYPFAGLTVCRVTGNTLADNFETIKFDGRESDCPIIDLIGDDLCGDGTCEVIQEYADLWEVEE